MTVRRLIIGGFLALAFCATLLQVIIDPSIENLASACTVLASSMCILLYIGWTGALEIQPLSTFSLFGFCTTTQFGALLAQTAAWTPLRSSLYDPLHTFGTLAFFQAVATAVHALYSFVLTGKQPRIGPVRGLLDRAGLYRTPAAGALWIMGGAGFVSFAFSGGSGVLTRTMHSMNFLTWAPFLIPLYRGEMGEAYCDLKRAIPLLVLYTVAVVLLGMAVNARGISFLGACTIGLSYLALGMRSRAPARISRGTLLKIAALGAIAIPLAGPMADMTTAMAVARAHRGKASAVEMIAYTLDAWRQPYLISQFRARARAEAATAYDENYIANPLLARFVETKFHDNSLHFADLLSTEDNRIRLRKISVATLWAILPTPLINALHISIDKAELQYSMGDYMVYLTRGLALGGRKTGSVFAEGLALMGPLFPFVYALICLCIFKLMDLLTVRPVSGMPATSALAKMQAWPFFLYGVTGEGIAAVVSFIARDVWQTMVIYLLVLSIAGLLLRATPNFRRRSGALTGAQ